jgi:hypothetical protein
MFWGILALLGRPLWLCELGIAKALHRLGDQPVVAALTTADGVRRVAAAAEHLKDLLGPVASRPMRGS